MDTREDESAKSRVGEVLRDKWTLDALIGVGGMAAVYAATHRNGRRGAVKMLHAELSRNKDVRQRFLREARVANKVGHPGAVEVLDDDVTDDGSVFLVMELLEGESLNDLLERSPGQVIDAASTIRIGVQLCEVLAAAHTAGIVHRDLKPDNLFLTKGGQLKVLDFGIARLREMSGQPGQSTTYGSATQTGSVMGTPAFMPPEQALGEWSKVDARSDLWAVGATLYTALSGRLAHEDETVAKVLLRAMTKPVAPLASVAPRVPSPLAAVVDRALARERDARFQSADAMRAALLAAAMPQSAAAVPFDPLAATTVDPSSIVAPPSYAAHAASGMAASAGPAALAASPRVAQTLSTATSHVASVAPGVPPHGHVQPSPPSVPGVAAPQGLVVAAATMPGTLPGAFAQSASDSMPGTLAGTVHGAGHGSAHGAYADAPRAGTVSTLAASSRSDFQPAPPRRGLMAAVVAPLVLALGGLVAAAVWLGRSDGTEPATNAAAAETDAHPEPVASEQPEEPAAPSAAPAASTTAEATPPPSVAASASAVARVEPVRKPAPSPSPVPAPLPKPPSAPVPKTGSDAMFKDWGKSTKN